VVTSPTRCVSLRRRTVPISVDECIATAVGADGKPRSPKTSAGFHKNSSRESPSQSCTLQCSYGRGSMSPLNKIRRKHCPSSIAVLNLTIVWLAVRIIRQGKCTGSGHRLAALVGCPRPARCPDSPLIPRPCKGPPGAIQKRSRSDPEADQSVQTTCNPLRLGTLNQIWLFLIPSNRFIQSWIILSLNVLVRKK
jgi:hypothetical protein